jgi:predicted permease
MLTALLTRLRSLLQRRRIAREMDDELRFHLEMEIASHVARGLSPTEARRRALRDLGGVDQTKEAIRDVRASWIDTAWQDAQQAVRSLRRAPGPSVLAVAMLGLGIGITTAMFTVVDALLVRPVPFRDPGQLAQIYMGDEHGGSMAVSTAVFGAWRQSPAFAAVESAAAETALVELDGAAATREIARVTTGVFDLLGGVRPVAGRLFDASEGRAGTDDRVLLSEDAWRSLYHADPTVIGRRLRINGEALTVVGILPSGFRFPSWNTVIWRAIDLESPSPAFKAERPIAYVRFASGMPRTDALRLATEAARAADAENAGRRPWVEPLAGVGLDAYYERAVPLLAGGVVLVFLVLCANVSSLLLARLTARQREFSMRSALGASRGRLIRQAMAESALLGALGVLSGILVGWALVGAARACLPEPVLLRTLNPLDVDARALVVSSLAGIAATLAASLLPAWIGTRTNVSDSLRVVDRGGTETRAARSLTRGLLVAEIALACTLLVGATLLVRSFVALSAVDRGLDVDGVLTATLSLPRADFPDRSARAAAARVLEEKVRELPAVRQVTWSYGLPPNGGAISWGEWQSDVAGAAPLNLTVGRFSVGPEFFDFFGIPILRGRAFQASDPDGTVVVGERFANALLPGLDPIGRTFTFTNETFHVVGLVREIHFPTVRASRDVVLAGLDDRPEFYEPFGGVGSYTMMSLRCDATCPDVSLVRRQLLGGPSAVRIVEVRALEDVYRQELAQPRAAAALGLAFAGIAVAAAAGGLFSVLSYAVGRRRREFGIRGALGASPREVGRLVVREGMNVACAGVAIGAVAAWSLARALASLQYGVNFTDARNWVVVLGLLGATTMTACRRPARDAMRTDPVRLLREE